MEHARVLIVDDSRAIQTIIRRGLAKLDSVEIETRVANDGAEAFDIAREWAPNLILVDWHMPNMNGLELLQAINLEMLGIKLGFVTSETSSSRLEEARAAGAKFILHKPFEVDSLINTVLPVLAEKDDPRLYDNTLNNKVRVADIKRLQTTVNNKCPFPISLSEADPIATEDIQPPYAMGFYHLPNETKITAMCLMDTHATWVIGAACTKTGPDHLLELMAQKTIPKNFLQACEAMAKTFGASFVDSANNSKPLTLGRFNLVNKPSAKLKSLLTTVAANRIDATLTAPDAGHGRVILVTP